MACFFFSGSPEAPDGDQTPTAGKTEGVCSQWKQYPTEGGVSTVYKDRGTRSSYQ